MSEGDEGWVTTENKGAFVMENAENPPLHSPTQHSEIVVWWGRNMGEASSCEESYFYCNVKRYMPNIHIKMLCVHIKRIVCIKMKQEENPCQSTYTHTWCNNINTHFAQVLNHQHY